MNYMQAQDYYLRWDRKEMTSKVMQMLWLHCNKIGILCKRDWNCLVMTPGNT